MGLVNTHSDIFCVLAGKGWVWSTHVEIHFVSSLIVRVLVNTCWDSYCVHAVMEGVWSTHVEIYFVSSPAWEEFCQHKLNYNLCPRWHGMGLVKQVEIHFVSSQAKDEFDQNILRYNLFHRWFRRVLVNTCWDSFCVHAVMGGVCSTHVVIHFVSSPKWRGLVITSWDTFCVLADMGWVWSTQVDIYCVVVGMEGVCSTHV